MSDNINRLIGQAHIDKEHTNRLLEELQIMDKQLAEANARMAEFKTQLGFRPKRSLKHQFAKKPTKAQGIVKQLFDIADAGGMSQGEIANKLGVNKVLITQWRRGRHQPSLFNLTCFAEVLGFTIILAPLNNAVAPRPSSEYNNPITDGDSK